MCDFHDRTWRRLIWALVERKVHTRTGRLLSHRHSLFMKSPVLRRLGIAVVCGAAGLVINSVALSAVAPLMLGRLVTLPVAILFGPWYGLVAAALGSIGRWWQLASSVAVLVILPVEGLLAGVFARRGKSALLAGVIVWSVVGL